MGSKTFWTPSPSDISRSTLTSYVNYLNSNHSTNLPIGDYRKLHKWSVDNVELFWYSFVLFSKLPIHPSLTFNVTQHATDNTLPRLVRKTWFPEHSLNFAECVLRHANDYPDETAIYCVSEAGLPQNISYAQLRDMVLRLAHAMRASNVKKGDRVAAVVSNNQYAVAAMLATAAVGAVWSSCSPDYGFDAIVSRFAQLTPKLLFFTSSYSYKGKHHDVTKNIVTAFSQLHSVRTLVSLPVTEIANVSARHKTWEEFTNVILRHPLQFERTSFSDPLYIMFSSGTTGAPKCILQGPGVLLNTVKEHLLHFDITSSSTMLYMTSTSWMLFNWLVSALVVRSKIVLYDGALFPPNDSSRVVNIARELGVTHFGAGAQYFQSLSQVVGPVHRHIVPIPSLTHLMATGSPSTLFHFQFTWNYFGRIPYLSMSGGTEINGCFALASPWKKVISSELQCAGLGMDVVVFDENAHPIKMRTGQLVCRNACPCMPLRFLNDLEHKRYRGSYFEDYGDHVWSHGDFALETEDGGFIISGRSDATLNPGGVRIGTSDIYEVAESVPVVSDALVTEFVDGESTKIVMFVVLHDGLRIDDSIQRNIRERLRMRLSPRHVPHKILQVSQIPYTFSGKKCEVPVKKMLMGKQVNNRGAVRNPTAFDEILLELQRAGLAIKANQAKVTQCRL